MLAATRLPANTLQGMMQLCCEQLLDDGNTFYSQRVFDLFPQMATANSGWAIHVAAGGSSVFGSIVSTDNANDSDYLEWTAFLPAGNYKLTALYFTTTDRGKVDLSVDGGAVVSTINEYSTPQAHNNLNVSSQFTVTEGSHTIRLTKNGKDASSSSYMVSLQHAQLVKQDATSALTSVTNVPHWIDVPVVFADSHTNFNTLAMNTAWKFGTVLASSGAQNSTVTLSFWGPKGAFTLAFLHLTFTNKGIYTVAVDGTTLGTVDGYAASDLPNILDTSLTGTLTSTGMHTITFTMATKHASSSAYYGAIQHIQIRMTSITEPLAQDLAPEVALFWPVFAEGNSGFSSLGASSNYAYYHYMSTAGTGQNDYLQFSSVLRPGTYRLDLVSAKWSDMGKYHCLVDSVDLGNVDAYAAGLTYNNVLSIAGMALTGLSKHTMQIKMVDKNASSSNYYPRLTIARLIRTGA